MKHFFTFLISLMFVFGVNAQYIYNDFDGNQNDPFSGWPNMPAIIANPDASGINTSANVGEWVRSAEQYAHVYTELPGKIDFSTGTLFQVKLHTPVECTVLFKIEDKNNGGVFAELTAEVTDLNTWVQLDFDFTDGQSDLYDKIVIFFDFANTVDNTFYFDDVTGPKYGEGGDPGEQVDLPVTFDDPEVNYSLADFGGNASEIVVDPTDGTNMVAKSTKTEGAEIWAGTTVGGADGFANPIPFTEDFTSMSVDVWSPGVGLPVRLKVEDAGDGNISVETEVTTTVAMDWETLVFDFSNHVSETPPLDLANTYDKASIFFNFGTSGADAGELTFYWDNMEFLSGPPPTARVQVIHNSADAAAGTVDVWLNNTLLLNDFMFRNASPFVDAPAGEEFTIAIKGPDSMDPNDPIWSKNYTLEEGKTYVLIANGIVSESGYDPATPFDIYVYDMGREAAGTAGNTDVLVFHGSTDAPTVDVVETGVGAGTIVDNLMYGDYQGYLELPTDDYQLSITDETGGTTVAVFAAPLATLGLENAALVTVASGFLNPDNNSGGPAFGLWVALPAGGPLVELPNVTSVNENEIDNELLVIYPNPARDVLFIENGDKFRKISIYNVRGQLVFTSEDNVGQINLENYANGIYTINAQDTDGKLYSDKFIVE